MSERSGLVPVYGLALSSVLATGCFFDVRGQPRPSRPEGGSLTVDWTIAGRSDQGACSRLGATVAELELLVYRDNEQVTEEYAPCEDFSLTVDLPAASYTGYTTLVDRQNAPVTSTLPLRDLVIVKGAELKVDVDFPTGSFL